MTNLEEKPVTTLADLATLTGGLVQGDGATPVIGACSLDNPRSAHIAMAVDIAKIPWRDWQEKPAALIVSKPPADLEMPLLIHDNPRLAFAQILRSLYPDPVLSTGVHPRAWNEEGARIDPTAMVSAFTHVDQTAQIGPGAQIWPGCYIGRNVVVGADTKIYPNVVVMQDVSIGARCIIHPGVVIGSDGFGFVPTKEGNVKVLQVGRVIIGDDVEIGANTTIDRATLDATVISDDVKIDNLVQIAHNVKIGPHSRIAAQSGMSGRVELGENVIVGGQAGFGNGIKIGPNSLIGARAAVIGNFPAGSKVSGYPARDHRTALRTLALQNRLPEILERLENLERRVSGGDTK
jgi:UDP-3-O-[3-hydroxymyristoyl] glucosamine N-acyltransferase